jgi:hypothetical protein
VPLSYLQLGIADLSDAKDDADKGPGRPCYSDLSTDPQVVLFSSCTHMRDMTPVSILVIDEDAFRRLKQFWIVFQE